MGCLFSCDDEDDEPMAETEVELSATRKGSQVRLEGGEVHGSGTVFADAAIHQDAAYWEVKIIKNGGRIVWGISRDIERDALNAALSIKEGEDSACVLDSANLDPTSNPDPEDEAPHSGIMVLNTNDVLGVYVQQSDLPMVQFYCNGKLARTVARRKIAEPNPWSRILKGKRSPKRLSTASAGSCTPACRSWAAPS
mmetsp:Transcript_22334/g.68930  ORF Transcript_22334/g.68930 Transcript_22334/m.68930 type:complete len:196 (-) Transcript_22334:2489-3076(-)